MERFVINFEPPAGRSGSVFFGVQVRAEDKGGTDRRASRARQGGRGGLPFDGRITSWLRKQLARGWEMYCSEAPGGEGHWFFGGELSVGREE